MHHREGRLTFGQLLVLETPYDRRLDVDRSLALAFCIFYEAAICQIKQESHRLHLAVKLWESR